MPKIILWLQYREGAILCSISHEMRRAQYHGLGKWGALEQKQTEMFSCSVFCENLIDEHNNF